MLLALDADLLEGRKDADAAHNSLQSWGSQWAEEPPADQETKQTAAMTAFQIMESAIELYSTLTPKLGKSIPVPSWSDLGLDTPLDCVSLFSLHMAGAVQRAMLRCAVPWSDIAAVSERVVPWRVHE